MDDGGCDVVGLVPHCVDDHTTRDGAIRTDAVGLRRARNLEFTRLGERRLDIETEGGCDSTARQSAFEEAPARQRHR